MQKKPLLCGKSIKKAPLNGIPSIGIQIHKPGQPEMEDAQVDLVSGKNDGFGYVALLSGDQCEKKLPFKRFVNWLKICMM